jgi:hypothetical protein
LSHGAGAPSVAGSHGAGALSPGAGAPSHAGSHGAGHAGSHGAGANLRQVQSAPVVLECEEELVAFLSSRQVNLSDLVLAGSDPFGRHFNAVGDGVADKVLEWAAHALEH